MNISVNITGSPVELSRALALLEGMPVDTQGTVIPSAKASPNPLTEVKKSVVEKPATKQEAAAAGVAETLTIEDVKNVMQTAIKGGKRDAVVATFAQFNAKALSDLDRKDYQAFVDIVNGL